MEDMWLHYFTNDDSFPFFIQYGIHEDTMFMHGHADFSELVVVLDGSADHVVDNERFPVKKGDVFFIEAGTLHAIGKGILIAEIQQNSNTTYRVYDYGRVGADGNPRALHIEKALDVTRLAPVTPAQDRPKNSSGRQLLGFCDYFFASCMEQEDFCIIGVDDTSFVHLLILEGDAVLKTENVEIPLKKGTSVFVPAGTGACRIYGKCKFINTSIH